MAAMSPPAQKDRPRPVRTTARTASSCAAQSIISTGELQVNLDQEDIGLRVDLQDLSAGVTSFKRLDETLDIPGGLKITRISPSYVDVKLEKVRERGVPVRVVLTGDPAPGFLVKSAKATPDRVVVIGAESEIKAVSEVVTEGIDVANVQENFTQTSRSRWF